MEKRYTISEIKELFDVAVPKAISELENDFKEITIKENKEATPMHLFAWTAQNMMAMATLKTKLFEEVL